MSAFPVLSEHYIGHGPKRGHEKRSFADEDSARAFWVTVHGRDREPRVYRCKFCRAWHISSPRSRRPPGWGRVLSPRQVKARIEVGQRWEDRTGVVWTVAQAYRHQGAALLEHDGERRIVSFRVLGRDHHLLEDES